MIVWEKGCDLGYRMYIHGRYQDTSFTDPSPAILLNVSGKNNTMRRSIMEERIIRKMNMKLGTCQ